jgi:hypothetical protein
MMESIWVILPFRIMLAKAKRADQDLVGGAAALAVLGFDELLGDDHPERFGSLIF